MKHLLRTSAAMLLLSSSFAYAGGGSPAPAPEPEPTPTPVSSYDGCTDYEITADQPVLNAPSRSFRKFSSSTWSTLYTPHHMAHDLVVNPYESTTMTAKFDYDFVIHKDLEDEYVNAYLFGTGMSDWEYLGRYMTNSDGKIYVNIPGRAAGDYQIRFVVEGDSSSTNGYLSVRNPGRQAVLFDIDGTLTTSDAEQIGDYLGLSTADAYHYARETVQEYRNKGYQLIFLTARPYWMAKGTREWLRNTMNQADWQLRLNEDGELLTTISGHAEYKAGYINELKAEGINIIRVYGNASTDIEAYEWAGIPKSETYIIGENAGNAGTQNTGSDYFNHFNSVVVNTPNAACK